MEACSLYDSIGDMVKNLTQCPISHELETFSRLLYRNKNQHRRDRYFQKLVRICKDSKKYQDFKLTEKFKFLQRSLAKYKFNLLNDKIDYHSDTEVQNFSSELAQQTSRCVLFVKSIIGFCEDTFWCSLPDNCKREICQHLTLGLFVPFNLMMCAILSRLWTYLKYHVKFLSQAHVILTRDHNASDVKNTIPQTGIGGTHVAAQSADIGEKVTLNKDFMLSRAQDFQLPVPVQSLERIEHSTTTTKVENACKKNAKSTITHHGTRHRWRNSVTSFNSHFCVDGWVKPKRKFIRSRRNLTLFKKKAKRKSIVEFNQEKGDSFIDNIFSSIK